MAQETYTEVTKHSWGSRLAGSFKGILFGFVLMALAIWLLFWNEGRAVRRARALTEGAGAVVSIGAGVVDPANEGRLVHLSGWAESLQILRDDTFGVAVDAIHLRRKVEMFQWREHETSTTKKKLGGSTETTSTYSYEKTWSSSVNNSRNFKVPAGHENPNQMPYRSSKTSASRVAIGPFALSTGLINSMARFEPLAIESLASLPGDLRWNARLADGGIYIGRSPTAPEVGDMRVFFEVVRPTTVSVVARQAGNRLEPYRTRNGGSVELLSHGVVPAQAMFTAARKSNRVTTWIFRLLGFLIMTFGLKRVFRPLTVLADVVPAIGRIMEASTGFVAYLLAAFLSLVVMSLAWLYHRPALAVVLLLLAGAALAASGLAILKIVKRKRPQPAAA